MKESIAKRIDKSVTLLFLITFLGAASILAYKFLNTEACSTDVVIEYKARTYEEGERIEFFSKGSIGDNLKWDFGDNTGIETGNALLHQYKESGVYKITLTVNNSCTYSKDITIKPKPEAKPAPVVVEDKPEPFQAEIEGPSRIKLGQWITVKETNPDSEKWLWNFGDNYQRATGGRKRQAKHKYKKVGTYTIIVKVNDKHTTSKIVKVYDEVSPCPLITKEQFANMLASFLKGAVQKTHFENYLISSYSNKKMVAVSYYSNDNIKLDFRKLSVNAFLKDIAENKFDYEIEVSKLYKSSRNCVKQIDVKVIKTKVTKIPKPEPAKPDPKPDPKPKKNTVKMVKKLSVEEFSELVKDVGNGKSKPSVFNQYLCNKTKPVVIMNDGKERMNIQKFAERVYRKRLRLNKILVTDLYYDDKTNCITKVKFNYKKLF